MSFVEWWVSIGVLVYIVGIYVKVIWLDDWRDNRRRVNER